MSNTEALKAQTPIAETASRFSWHVLRFVIGILLLGTGLLKAHMLATQPVIGDGIGILNSRWLNIFAVEMELALSVWLFVGLMSRVTWCVALVCFSVFTVVSAEKWISGSESCGCFGAVQIYPAYTMTLDLIIIGLLIVFRPKVKWTFGLNIAQKQALNYCLIVVPLGGFLLWSMSQVELYQLREIGQVLEQGSVVKLEPRAWVDKKFPLRDHCDIGKQLVTGHWLVMLRRNGSTLPTQAAAPLVETSVMETQATATLGETPAIETAIPHEETPFANDHADDNRYAFLAELHVQEQRKKDKWYGQDDDADNWMAEFEKLALLELQK